MNLTELARILRISPQELKLYLPKFGYDLGAKAIKINRNTANKIIKAWPVLRRKIQAEKDAEKKEKERLEKENQGEAKKITIPSKITVREFSEVADIPVNKILAELMRNRIFVSLNEKIKKQFFY